MYGLYIFSPRFLLSCYCKTAEEKDNYILQREIKMMTINEVCTCMLEYYSHGCLKSTYTICCKYLRHWLSACEAYIHIDCGNKETCTNIKIMLILLSRKYAPIVQRLYLVMVAITKKFLHIILMDGHIILFLYSIIS